MNYIETLENKLAKDKNINIKEIDINKIDDMKNIKVDTNKKIKERALDFFEKVNNPYIFKSGDIIVMMSFSDDSKVTPMNCIDKSLIEECKKRNVKCTN